MSRPPKKLSNEQTLEKIRAAARKSARQADETAKQLNLQLVHFREDNLDIEFNFDAGHDTIWASQAQMAELFGKDRDTIAEHIQNIFKSGELIEEAVTRKFPVTASDGKTYETKHYNLDVILSVGYRVSSAKATKFRQWATKTLKGYIVDGYAINERRMQEDPKALRGLAARVRELRSNEKQIYQAVRDCFAEVSTDYDGASNEARKFYAKLQDKFLWAVTEKTAAQIVLERADGTKPCMGITVNLDHMPKLGEAQVGKNYLQADELYTLHLLCEQFLLFAESKAIRGQTLTMAQMSAKFNELLETADYPVFPGYTDTLREKANNHATQELELFRQMVRQGELPKPGAAA